MKSFDQLKNEKKILIHDLNSEEGIGTLYLLDNNEPCTVIFSNYLGWDHVSVSYRNRCLTWEEMCQVKDIFFDEEETVVQYHPKKSEYVNLHPYVLHLWKKQNEEFELPKPIKNKG